MLEMLKQTNSRAGVFLVLMDPASECFPSTVGCGPAREGECWADPAAPGALHRTGETLTRYCS